MNDMSEKISKFQSRRLQRDSHTKCCTDFASAVPSMYALYAWLICSYPVCMAYMYALYVWLMCMPYMYAVYFEQILPLEFAGVTR